MGFNDDRRRMGLKHALLRQLRYHAGAEWLGGRLDELEPRFEHVRTEVEGNRAVLTSLTTDVPELRHQLFLLEHAVRNQERLQRVQTVMDWIAGSTLVTRPLVSVVLPTRNRASLLPRAVASILDQEYAEWELLIVDDGSTDGTAEVIAGFDDHRIRTYRGESRGVCAARNVAIDDAKGEILAYVDDDNRMHPAWLRSVVWAFEQRPEVDVLYGAFVVDDILRVAQDGEGDLPRLYFHAYDHDGIVQGNVADMGAIAHRAGLPQGRFDESLTEMGDWDLLLRLTEDKAPLELPALACYYHTDADNRLSAGPTGEQDKDLIRKKNRR